MLFNYKSFLGFSSICDVKIYQTETKVIVIYTEIPENKGSSVTNATEIIATNVFNKLQFKLDIKPESIIWIEHYPVRGTDYASVPESFDIVRFVWDGVKYNNPNWTNSSKEEVEALIINAKEVLRS